MLQVLTPKFYAGIGSRETPSDVLNTMNKIARAFYGLHYFLRSGGANGADKMFEAGVVDGQSKEIWLPWRNFNENLSQFYLPEDLSKKDTYTLQFIEIAKVARKYHPAWDKLKIGGKKMMTRNVCQILGFDLQTPVEFVVCWTKDGSATGGTGQAIRIAEDRGIPIFNLYWEVHLSGLRNYYRNIKNGVLV